MNKHNLIVIIFFLGFLSISNAQSFMINQPKLEFDGQKLSISYDLVNKSQADIFFVWVEIRNKDGAAIRAKSFKGEVGDSLKPGSGKKIIWVPEEDAIYLDEDVTVELKGEKYVRSFNKGSMVLLSAALPGAGQTKISKGKPWWLAGVAAYGTLAGGLVIHKKYVETYNAYKGETDPVERGDLFDKSQKQKSLSGTLIISSAAIWAANIIMVSATPNKYKPLEHLKFSLNTMPVDRSRVTMLSMKLNF